MALGEAAVVLGEAHLAVVAPGWPLPEGLFGPKGEIVRATAQLEAREDLDGVALRVVVEHLSNGAVVLVLSGREHSHSHNKADPLWR